MVRPRWNSRRYVLGSGIVGSVLAVAVFWWIWPRERMLMDVARSIEGVNLGKQSAYWVSSHQILLITSPSMWEQGNSSGGTATKKEQISAELLDTANGMTTPLAGFTALLNKTGRTPFRVEMSPDGDWLLWQDVYVAPRKSGVRGWRFPSTGEYSAHLDGTHFRAWMPAHVDETFFLDSQYLVRLRSWKPMLTVCDLSDPTKDRQYPKPEQAQTILTRYAAHQPVFNTVRYPNGGYLQDSAQVESYHTEDRLQRLLSLQNEGRGAPQPIQVHPLTFPGGSSLGDSEYAPQGRAVFYQLSVSRLPPLQAWLNRLLPRLDLKPMETEELWVSAGDGQGLHKIGSVPIKSDANGSSEDHLLYCQWLPDGRQISLVYHNKLYVVPAVPEK